MFKNWYFCAICLQNYNGPVFLWSSLFFLLKHDPAKTNDTISLYMGTFVEFSYYKAI